MKISMINIIVSAFVLSVTAGLFYLNRRPAENIDDVTLLTLFKKWKNEKVSFKIKDERDWFLFALCTKKSIKSIVVEWERGNSLLVFCCYAVLSVWWSGSHVLCLRGAWSRRCFAEIGFGLTSWLMVDDSPLVGRISRCWMSLLGYALCVLLMKRIIGRIVCLLYTSDAADEL